MTQTSTPASNVYTHTGMVHAGRVHTDGRTVPACFGNTKVADLHFAAPTEDPITCSRCTAAPRGSSVEDKKARAAERRAAARIAALEERAAQPARRLAGHLREVEFLSAVVADTTRTPDARAAAAADLAERVEAYATVVSDAQFALATLAA